MLKFIIDTIDANCKVKLLRWFMLTPFFLLFFIFFALYLVLTLLTVGVLYILWVKKDAMEYYNLMISAVLLKKEKKL